MSQTVDNYAKFHHAVEADVSEYDAQTVTFNVLMTLAYDKAASNNIDFYEALDTLTSSLENGMNIQKRILNELYGTSF